MPADTLNIRPLRPAHAALTSDRVRAASQSFSAAATRLDTARASARQAEAELRQTEQDDRAAALAAVGQDAAPPKAKAPRLRERHAEAVRAAEAAETIAVRAQVAYLAELRREAEGVRARAAQREAEARQRALRALDAVDAELREAADWEALAQALDASLLRGNLSGFRPELSERQVAKRIEAVTGDARGALGAQLRRLAPLLAERADAA